MTIAESAHQGPETPDIAPPNREEIIAFITGVAFGDLTLESVAEAAQDTVYRQRVCDLLDGAEALVRQPHEFASLDLNPHQRSLFHLTAPMLLIELTDEIIFKA